jgi:hypothetical protein
MPSIPPDVIYELLVRTAELVEKEGLSKREAIHRVLIDAGFVELDPSDLLEDIQ